MSDMERATETSSSSQLETVQPFTIEESPGLEVGFESPKLVMDSSTLMCNSIGRSPAASGAVKSPGRSHRRKHRLTSWTNSNQLPQASKQELTGTTSSHTTSDRAAAGRLRISEAEDDFATNQSAKSTATYESSSNSGGGGGGGASGSSSGNSSSSSSSSKGTTNSNRGSDALENSDDVTSQTTTELVEGVPDDSGGETDADQEAGESSTDAGATGIQSTDSATNEQTDSVFANLADSAEVASADPDRQPQQRQSLRVNKNEIANLIEKAILDFCSSRTVETMRRMFAGVTNDTETLQRDGGRHDDKSATTPHPVTGELVKEGVIIGDIDVFAPRMQQEFILPVRDSLIAAFLKEPGVFRAICYRTRCQVEVTRRLLNRKLCIGGRWHKYMIIRIVGPTQKCILNCDVLLQKAVPSYKARRMYQTPAVCRMFLREDVPDNAELYFSYQRTGGTSQRYGSLKLESPYRQTAIRTIGICPWKFGLFKVGKLAFSGSGVKMCMKHVYPSLGYQTTTNLEREYQGVNAADRIHLLHDQFQVKRQIALNLKRTLTIPVCR